MESKELPILSHESEIRSSLKSTQVLLISGETGSGKSTQVPRLVWERGGRVLVTQPRRLAAVSMAGRVGRELEGQAKVDYTIRFEDTSTEKTDISFVTDGILLRLLRDGECFRRFATIVIDEVHERSSALDLTLYLLKKSLKKFPEARLVLMSATLPLGRLREYFQDYSPIHVDVPGARQFPISVVFRGELASDRRPLDAVSEAVMAHHLSEPEGDFLVFLPGAGECRAVMQGVFLRLKEVLSKGGKAPSAQLCTLFGTQDLAEQKEALRQIGEPGFSRKIVFSTNVAETSLTLPNVSVVFDCGLAKQPSFSKTLRAVKLGVKLISRAQAVQRAGRAGRTRPGKVVRLYSQKEFEETMAEGFQPEIQNSELRDFVLAVIDLGETDLRRIDLLDPPDFDAADLALEQLFAAQLVDIVRAKPTEEGRQAGGNPFVFVLTELGRLCLRFPLDPLQTKALLASKLMNVEEEMSQMVAILSLWEGGVGPEVTQKPDFVEKMREMAAKPGDLFAISELLNSHRNLFQPKTIKQISSVKSQLLRILSKLTPPTLQRALATDPCCQEFSSFKNLSSDQRLQLSLFSSFFVNSATKTVSESPSYRLSLRNKECFLDSMSLFELTEQFPEEVAASAVKGEGQMEIPVLFGVFKAPKGPLLVGYKSRLEELRRFEDEAERERNSKGNPAVQSSKNKLELAKERYAKRVKTNTS